MKKFIVKLIIFISIPLLMILSLDIFLRNQNSIYKEKYLGAIKVKDSIEVVILGNSHANYGVDPKVFDLFAYNLANISQSIYFDKRITISLMPYLKHIKYVLISVDYHSLYFSSQPNRDIWSYYGHGIKYKNNNYLLADISPALFGYPPKISISLLKKKIMNNIKYGNHIIDFDVENGINLNDTIEKGFLSFEGINETQHTTGFYKNRIDKANNNIKTSNEKNEVLADLSDFLEILLAKNITPILYTTPTYREYNKYLDQSILNENIKDINAICRKYHIKYWNFMDSNIFEKNDFYNGDHLNKAGAFKFGKILNDSINKIEIQAHTIVNYNSTSY